MLARCLFKFCRQRQLDNQPCAQNQEASTQVFTYDELPAQEHGDHDSQFDDQIGRSQQESQGRNETCPFLEERLGRCQRCKTAGTGDKSEECGECDALGPGFSH